MEQVYNSVEDIDLFIGMTLENPEGGAITGNTFRCLIGDQFARLKWGDRFFYDLSNQPGSFNNGKITPLSISKQDFNIMYVTYILQTS